MDLKEIANSGGYGSGKRAIELQRQRDERNAWIPEPSVMAEMPAVTSAHSRGAPVGSLGYCPITDQDWALECDSYGLVEGADNTASTDAQAIAAIWNAFRDGDLVWKAPDLKGGA